MQRQREVVINMNNKNRCCLRRPRRGLQLLFRRRPNRPSRETDFDDYNDNPAQRRIANNTTSTQLLLHAVGHVVAVSAMQHGYRPHATP